MRRTKGLPFSTRARLRAFRALEKLSDWRGNAAAPGLSSPPPSPRRDAWWVFVSTIGELNAVAPLLDAMAAQFPDLAMVLITDHAHDLESYAARYPKADVVVSLGHSRDALALMETRPPRLVVLAEIPLIPSDAPCRCSAAFLLQARACGAHLIGVNGWLYGYGTSCRMDEIERRWLTDALLSEFDAICVQTEAIRSQLIAAGASPHHTHVTGNLKLDVLRRPPTWTPADARHPQVMQSLLDSGRPTVVAGSLTREDEIAAVLDAFGLLREAHPQALLVLAPRHPEVPDNMTQIQAMLELRQLQGIWRSLCTDGLFDPDHAVLILDTMGDLRDFYAMCAMAHVGVDHNVLEPLAFAKATSVMPGWEATYPSYPVYTALRDAGVLLTARTAEELAGHWRIALDTGTGAPVAPGRIPGADRASSLDRHLEILSPWLAASASPRQSRHGQATAP